MKHLFKVLIFCAVLLPLMSACSLFGDKNETRYLAVKMANSKSWSIIDIKDGNVIADEEFNNQPSIVANDMFYVKNDKGLYEFYNVNDKNHTVGDAYKSATYFQNGRAVVGKEGEGLSLINTDGEIVAKLASSIKKAGAFENGYSIVANEDGKFGFINTDGKLVVKMNYDEVYPFSKDGYAVVAKNDENDENTVSYSIIDDKGKKLFGFNSGKYEKVLSGFFNGAIAVQSGEEIVYLDETGAKMLRVGDAKSGEYGFYKGMTIYADGEEYGIKNKDGEKVIKAKYSTLVPVENGNYMARKDDKYMIINKDGEVLTADKYAEMAMVSEDRFLVLNKEGGNITLIDEVGNEIGNDSFVDVSLVKDATDLISSDEGLSDSNSGESYKSHIGVLEPTGDPAADARQAADEAIALMNKEITSMDDLKNLESELKDLQARYEDFYKAKGEEEFKKFTDEFEKLEKDPEYAKKIEEAQKNLMEKAMELKENEAEEAVSAIEDVEEDEY